MANESMVISFLFQETKMCLIELIPIAVMLCSIKPFTLFTNLFYPPRINSTVLNQKLSFPLMVLMHQVHLSVHP